MAWNNDDKMGQVRLAKITIENSNRGYWIVNGRIPLELAKLLYELPLRSRIRVAGHCEAPPPEEPWITWYCQSTGKKLLLMAERTEVIKARDSDSSMMRQIGQKILDECLFSDERASIGNGFIETYHIDGDEALAQFLECCRTWGLFR